jgi:hypothetical protein
MSPGMKPCTPLLSGDNQQWKIKTHKKININLDKKENFQFLSLPPSISFISLIKIPLPGHGAVEIVLNCKLRQALEFKVKEGTSPVLILPCRCCSLRIPLYDTSDKCWAHKFIRRHRATSPCLCPFSRLSFHSVPGVIHHTQPCVSTANWGKCRKPTVNKGVITFSLN